VSPWNVNHPSQSKSYRATTGKANGKLHEAQQTKQYTTETNPQQSPLGRAEINPTKLGEEP